MTWWNPDGLLVRVTHDLTPREAAALLGVHRDTLTEYVERGHLTCRRLPSGHRRYSRSEIERLLEPEQPTEAAS